MKDRQIRALLIEDDPEDALLLMRLMAQSDWPSFRFRLECAETLAAGLQILAKGEIEVLLLDLMLPDSQGLETVRRVRTRFPDVPVVVLTGLRDEALGLDAVLHGAQDYQVKGAIEAHALKRTISYAVERHRMVAGLKGIIDKAADGMLVIDAGGVVRYTNPAAQALFGAAGEPLLGRPFPYKARPDSTSELSIPTKDGERAAEMRVAAIDWDDQPASLATIRDITDLRRVEQLKAEVKEGRRMDKLKDELMSAVSHEMRSPLTVIKAAAINLKDPELGPLTQDQGTMIGLLYKNIVRLQKILDHILDLARLESGRAPIRLRPLKPANVIRDIVRGFQLLASERGLEIGLDLPKDLPDISADQELFTQVLSNLLDNALRFAKARVTVGVAGPGWAGSARPARGRPAGAVVAEPRTVLFTVSDDGRGIPKERLGELFVKFVQIDRGARDDGYKGTGLGLAICKEIVEQQNGRIWAESEAGAGASFFFTLPLADAGAR